MHVSASYEATQLFGGWSPVFGEGVECTEFVLGLIGNDRLYHSAFDAEDYASNSLGAELADSAG